MSTHKSKVFRFKLSTLNGSTFHTIIRNKRRLEEKKNSIQHLLSGVWRFRRFHTFFAPSSVLLPPFCFSGHNQFSKLQTCTFDWEESTLSYTSHVHTLHTPDVLHFYTPYLKFETRFSTKNVKLDTKIYFLIFSPFFYYAI